MTDAIIHLEGIEKVFLTDEVETHALSNIHLDVKKGEWLAIVGPSGSGKTTLLAILGLLDTASGGTFVIDGRPVQDLSPRERAHVRNEHIGFIFQSFNLIGKQRVETALARVGMSHRAQHMPSQLSGGQQQRIAVARAVAGDPLILLADEPTGNLDSKNGQAVMKLLSELHQSGSTLLMVTHDPAYARLATRTVSLFDGRIVEETDTSAA